ncbi:MULTISPECIES: DUF4245 domain-containing protein [Arthrobacter]|uniref:DUF4245 domain-containing protein n=1 Tax=Arthrobacter terricola TaxID=2547396 RepID=A0A4R5KNF4_9MICC|nr:MULTISPECIES: DUF4245 domain-containing protein [Arthrobacter]MBT8161202.1 DUF4245 domain-containing protein [Arthrobacter sp. GN70]TDF96448.1 DUF4245 domain-containing protein [Arthrobacter terricola]
MGSTSLTEGTAAASHPVPAGQPVVKPVIAAKAAKRANASVIGMIIALLLCVLAFLPIVLMNPAPKSATFRPDVDVAATSANAKDVAGFTPVAPNTGETFSPNYARWESGTNNGVPTWEVGYLTPKQAFIGIIQTRKGNPTWVYQETGNAPVTGTRSAGGHDWELHDTGKGSRSLVLNYRGTTVILSGTAGFDEFDTMATAVVKAMDAAPVASPDASSPASDTGSQPATTKP